MFHCSSGDNGFESSIEWQFISQYFIILIFHSFITLNFRKTEKLLSSVSRNFLSEIADFSSIYRQIRQVFGSKSRKIRQFIAPFSVIFTPAIGQIALHLPTTQKISSFIAFLCIKIFQLDIFLKIIYVIFKTLFSFYLFCVK